MMLAAVGIWAPAGFGVDAPVNPVQTTDFWKNPSFVEDFLGSYGFLSDVEPKISAEEQKLFKDLVELIQNKPAEAITKLKAAITPESSGALDFILANLYVQEGKLAEASQEYMAAIKKFPNFRRAHKNEAIVLVQQGSFKEAIPELTKVLELGGEDANTYGLLAYCYLSLEKYISAESAYRKAILYAPDNIDWKLGLARSLMAQQKSRETIALFEELIQKDPAKTDYWLLQANAYLDLGEPMKAAENYEILRRMNKATGPSLMVLGDIYLSRDLKDLALESYLASLNKEPGQDIKRPLRAAEILTSRQAWDEARKLVDEIKKVYESKISEPDRLKALKLQAKIDLAQGENKDAAKSLQQIIDTDPLDGEAILILAGYLARTDETDKAQMLYERAAKLSEYQVNALVMHGQLLVSLGKYEKAAKLLQQAQTIKPRESVAKYLEQVQRLAKATGS